MNNLTKTLLAGVALCALATVPAVAENAGPIHFSALHGGRVVNKTKMPNHGATHITYTFGIYTEVPASTPLNTTVHLSENDLCGVQKIKFAPKKTHYAKIGLEVLSYSGCVQVVPTYTLIRKPSPGDTDEFEVSFISKFEQDGTKYKETLNLDYNVDFE